LGPAHAGCNRASRTHQAAGKGSAN
jgi:hypothetical protein